MSVSIIWIHLIVLLIVSYLGSDYIQVNMLSLASAPAKVHIFTEKLSIVQPNCGVAVSTIRSQQEGFRCAPGGLLWS